MTMPVIILPGFRYTKAQIKSAMTEELADKLRFKGYYLQFDGQYYALVHHSEAYGGRTIGTRTEGDVTGTLEQNDRMGGTASFEEPGTPAKRTPQERLESLVKKMWPTVKDVGHIPGLKDEDILPIVANLNLQKRRMTGEDVRAVAARFLETAEKKHEEKLSHQITRHED